jgi:archaemetzincin
MQRGRVAALLTGHSSLRRLIAIVPVGPVPVTLMQGVAAAVGRSFAARPILLPPAPIPAVAHDAAHRQYRAAGILSELMRWRHPEWERLLGLTVVDLAFPGLQYVFGVAEPAHAAALVSTARLRSGAATRSLVERRVTTEAVHELAHTYGLQHCHDMECIMALSASAEDVDRKGMTFCAVHAAELARILGRGRGQPLKGGVSGTRDAGRFRSLHDGRRRARRRHPGR